MKDRPALTLAVIEGLKAQGLNQSEIAELFGVTRQAVSWHVKTYGGDKPSSFATARQRGLEVWPWITDSRFRVNAVFQRLRDHAEYMIGGGEGLDYLKLSRLKGFYEKLGKGLVVEFDPGIPPHDGVAAGGFAYRERLESDEGLMIRVNQHTHLSDEGRKVWRLPDVMPDPLATKGLKVRG
jgi:hypothetical protein